MKTITVTAWRRPQYLMQIVSDLAKNTCDDWRLYCAIEPGNRQTLQVCQRINFVETVIIQNPKRLGVRDNPFSVLTRAFNDGSDVNIYLEEDITISQDVTSIADWYLENGNTASELCAALHVKSRTPDDPLVLQRQNVFSALGLIMLRDQWKKHIQPNWYSDGRGWDWAIHEYLNSKKKLSTLAPRLSRSTHIGLYGGVHYRHQRHGAEFDGLVLYDGPPRPQKDYLFVEKED